MLLWLLACSHPTPGVAPIGTADPHVLILVVDGVRVLEFSSATESDLTGRTGEDYASDAWDALQSQAMIVRSAYNIGLTSTSPGHAMLLTGTVQPIATVPVHTTDVGPYRPLLPTLFEEARAQKGWGEEDALLLANSIVMPGSTHSIAPGWGEGARWEMLTSPQDPENPVGDDEKVIQRLKEIINDGPPHVMLVNLHAADREGHTGVLESYLDRVQRQARLVGQFWNWLQDHHPDYVWQLQMVITADHGRHTIDTIADSWSNHGDSCIGCRQVPWFFTGHDVKAEEVEGAYSLTDVAPTLANHLDIELPWASGLPFGPDSGTSRQGTVKIVQSGEHLAFSEYLDTLEHRSRVVVDGEVLSSPDAWAAEAPSLLESEDGTRLWACFRELRIDPEEDYLPWEARCLEKQDGAWKDIAFADGRIGPLFEASLVERDGHLWAGWLYTPLTRIEGEDEDAVVLSQWDGEKWSSPFSKNIDFATTNISVAANGKGLVLMAATNDAEPNQAYSRHIQGWVWSEKGIQKNHEFRILPELSPEGRVELPAVRSLGNHLWMAMAEVDEAHRGLGWVESEDGGSSWGETSFLPAEGLFLNMPPKWDGNYLVWAQVQGEEAQLCRSDSPEGVPQCLNLGSPRVDSFVVAGGQATVVIDQGVGDWVPVSLSW